MPIVGIYQGARRLIVSWDRNVEFATREDDSRVRLCASDSADGLGKLNALRSQVESELTRVMISMNRQKTKPMVKRTAMMNDWSAMPWVDWVVGKPRWTVCNCGSRGFKVSRERLLRECSEEEGVELIDAG